MARSMITVEQAEDHLKCRRNSLEEHKRALREAAARVDRSAASCELLERQIAQAKLRGKTRFDPDRFLVPRQNGV